MNNIHHSPMFRWNAENGALLSALHNGLQDNGLQRTQHEIRDNITGCGVMRKIASVCFGVIIIGPAYSDDVFKGADEKVSQCSLRPEELIGLDDLGLSAKCGAFSSRVSYAYGKTKVDRFTYLIGSKPWLYVRMRNGIVESAHKP